MAADVAAIRAMGVRSIRTAYATFAPAAYVDNVIDTWWDEAYIEASLHRTRTLVATDPAGAVLGSATLGERDGVPVLWKLDVDPSVQGVGIGRALIEAVFALLSARAELTLAYVDGNERAAAFYRSLGLAETQREPDRPGCPDQVWMSIVVPG